jgi:hypothetical protein
MLHLQNQVVPRFRFSPLLTFLPTEERKGRLAPATMKRGGTIGRSKIFTELPDFNPSSNIPDYINDLVNQLKILFACAEAVRKPGDPVPPLFTMAFDSEESKPLLSQMAQETAVRSRRLFANRANSNLQLKGTQAAVEQCDNPLALTLLLTKFIAVREKKYFSLFKTEIFNIIGPSALRFARCSISQSQTFRE